MLLTAFTLVSVQQNCAKAGVDLEHAVGTVSRLAGEHLGIPPEKLVEHSGQGEVWAPLLKDAPRPGPG